MTKAKPNPTARALPAQGSPQRSLYDLAAAGGLTTEHRLWYAPDIAALEKAGLIEINPRKQTHYRPKGERQGPPPLRTHAMRFAADVLAAVDAKAKAQGVTRSEVIRDAVEAYLGAGSAGASDQSGTRPVAPPQRAAKARRS